MLGETTLLHFYLSALSTTKLWRLAAMLVNRAAFRPALKAADYIRIFSRGGACVNANVRVSNLLFLWILAAWPPVMKSVENQEKLMGKHSSDRCKNSKNLKKTTNISRLKCGNTFGRYRQRCRECLWWKELMTVSFCCKHVHVISAVELKHDLLPLSAAPGCSTSPLDNAGEMLLL